MIQLLPCPACHQPTVFPEGVTLEATVRCPHCDEQFVVGEMLTSRFGSWIVVNDPATPHGIQRADEFPHTTSELALVAGTSLDRTASTTDDSGPLELQADSAQPVRPKTDWSKFEPITHEQFERMRRKARSPIWSLLQIVLGGVAAVPISLLLIWHLIGTDVAGAGPLVGRYVPWLVPEKFRPLADAQALDEEPATRDSTPLVPGASGFRRFDDVLNPGGSNAPAAPAPEVGSNDALVAGGTAEPKRPLPSAPELNNSSIDMPSIPPKSINQKPEQATIDGVVVEVDEELSGSESNNVFALIQQSSDNLDAWSNAVRDKSTDLKGIALQVYNGLIDLTEAIEELPDGNPVHRVVNNKMELISRTVKNQIDVQKVVRQGASFWLKNQSESVPFALALIVDAESVVDNGQNFRMQFPDSKQMTVATRPLAIEIPKSLSPRVSGGVTYLVLGTVNAAKLEDDQNGTNSAPEEFIFTANYLYAL